MKNPMSLDRGLASFLTAGLLVMSRIAGAETPAAQPAQAPAARMEAMLYTVEFAAPCGPPVYPGMLTGIMNSSAGKTWRFKTGGAPPLVSREAVQQSTVATSGATTLPAARIFAEIGPGGALSFQNDSGKSVVVQVDVKSICWDIDQDQATKLAKMRGSAHVLLSVLRSEDLTAQVNPNGELGNQKSFAVSLDLTLLDSATGDVVSSFTDEVRVMDVSASGALRRGAKTLVTKGLKALSTGT